MATKKHPNDTASATEQVAKNGASAQEFAIQKIYLRDASLEAPNTPFVFREEWKPNIELSLNNNAKILEQDVYQVHLQLTVKTYNNEKIAFIVEVEQAGIFTIRGFPEENLKPMLGSYCPGIIFPYARETVADLVSRAGFPQLNLAPVNFDALYLQYTRQQAEETPQKESSETE